MIHFFRKLRNLPAGKAGKMADDNRPLRYMRYAIGEIVLVVIGILIALQINTWNEWRKERKVEQTILISLKEDLDRNKKLIQEDIAAYSLLSNKMDILLQCYNNKTDYNDSLNEYFHLARIFPNPQLSFGTYQEIKTKGMDIIQSELLRKRIRDLYEVHFSEMTQNIHRLENALKPVQMENQVKLFYVKKGELIPNDGNKIMMNDEYFNIVSQRKRYYSFFQQLCKKSLEELDKVQLLIDQEIAE